MLAIAVPSVELLIGVVGGVAIGSLGLIIPPLLYLASLPGSMRRLQQVRVLCRGCAVLLVATTHGRKACAQIDGALALALALAISLMLPHPSKGTAAPRHGMRRSLHSKRDTRCDAQVQ